MTSKYTVEQIKDEAKKTRRNLMKRKNTKPPMCNRLTMSVSSLISECDKVLWLVKKIEGKV